MAYANGAFQQAELGDENRNAQAASGNGGYEGYKQPASNYDEYNQAVSNDRIDEESAYEESEFERMARENYEALNGGKLEKELKAQLERATWEEERESFWDYGFGKFLKMAMLWTTFGFTAICSMAYMPESVAFSWGASAIASFPPFLKWLDKHGLKPPKAIVAAIITALCFISLMLVPVE